MAVSAGIHVFLSICSSVLVQDFFGWNADGLFIPLSSIRSPNEEAIQCEFVMLCERL